MLRDNKKKKNKDNLHRIHTETKLEMAWTNSKNEGQ